MSSQTLKLEALGITFVLPEKSAFHNEGYMDPTEFDAKIFRLVNGRDRRLFEIEFGLGLSYDFGGLESYIKKDGINDVRHTHIYRNKSIKKVYPLNLFVLGHEEAHTLQPAVFDRYDLLKQKLESLGFNSKEFEDLSKEEQVAHVGGLLSLQTRGILVGKENCQQWREFLKQSQNVPSSNDFKKSLDWFLANKK